MSKRIAFAKNFPVKQMSEDIGQAARIGANSGVLICQLTTLTPLSIRSVFKNTPNPAWIPGSSLRGMVRNMAEVLGAGCGRLTDGATAVCTAERTCVVCRVFGYVEKEEGTASKVKFRDSDRIPVKYDRIDVPFERPAPEGVAGWILFPHDDDAKTYDGKEPFVIEETKFRFRVDYLNLDAEEYAIFRFALELKYGAVDLCHKLGFAKAAGFGSCVVRVLGDKARPVWPEIERFLKGASWDTIAKARSYRK